MTQVASLLAIATVFIVYGLILQSGRGGGGLIRETELPVQELELKVQGGGAYARSGGSVIVGFYSIF